VSKQPLHELIRPNHRHDESRSESNTATNPRLTRTAEWTRLKIDEPLKARLSGLALVQDDGQFGLRAIVDHHVVIRP